MSDKGRETLREAAKVIASVDDRIKKENADRPICCLGQSHDCMLNVNDGFCRAKSCIYQVEEIEDQEVPNG